MSNIASTWARAQRCGSSSAKHVLRELADVARDEEKPSTSGKTWPAHHVWVSVAYLAEVTEQDRKTVLHNLHRLEAAGLIVRTGTDGRTGQITVYRLPVNSTESGTVEPVDKKPEIGTGTESGTVPVFPSNSTVFPLKQYQFSVETVPKTGHGTILNHKDNTEPQRRRRRSAVEHPLFPEFYAAYPRKVAPDQAAKAFAKVDPDRDLLETMLAAIKAQGLKRKCDHGEAKFVPHPATWLSQGRWKDEETGARELDFIGSAVGRSHSGVAL